MSSTSFLFITAENADVKLVNRLLLTLRNWECGVDSDWDTFVLVTAKTNTLPTDMEPTQPPLPEFRRNEWKGAAIKDIETVVLATDREKQAAHGEANWPSNNLDLFLVLDDQGAADGTIALFQRAIDDDAEPIAYPERFNKFRTPWTNAYLDWCNLDISNIGFLEMCDWDGADKGKNEADGVWWTYSNTVGELTSEEDRKKRDAVIKELAGLGLA
ncbi:uncharacterized protein LY79DRAFT_669836 [Colletotrichum navitas]|uniref:Uncharacterized protein n=1 Tax=Colletotrichum navitas TaxID=681940 RepID=A0AAD8PZ11_9PEZI|nr:uncharacterized protein LY79DRAFT_669836 [Colletotrichum navitas]KAK1590630.1 hypothetical protein LY79DRAFT_669836 [Colletotrichum navitas]